MGKQLTLEEVIKICENEQKQKELDKKNKENERILRYRRNRDLSR